MILSLSRCIREKCLIIYIVCTMEFPFGSIERFWVFLDNYTKQHPAQQQVYDHLPLITQTTQIRWRPTGCCLRSKDELITVILVWMLTHENGSVDRLVKSYGNLFCAVTWYCQWLDGCLGFWHINFCRLFHTKSIFIQIISLTSNNSV